jgi:hypothetical protein
MMTKSQLAAALVPIIVLVILVSACTDQDLVTVSKALKDTAQSVAVLQNIVIAANSQHLLSNAVTRQLLEAAMSVNRAGRQAVEITRNLNRLTPGDRRDILSILQPIIIALADTQNSVVSTIPDMQTRTNIQTTLGLIQASVNSAQIALASK